MLKVWRVKEPEHKHEKEDLEALINALRLRVDALAECIHLLIAPRINGCAVDALLVTTSGFCIIEMKRIKAGTTVIATENVWKKRLPNGSEETMHGGSENDAGPFEQVARHRQGLDDYLRSDCTKGFFDLSGSRKESYKKFIKGVVVIAPELRSGLHDENKIPKEKNPWFSLLRISDFVKYVWKEFVNDPTSRFPPEELEDLITECFGFVNTDREAKQKETTVKQPSKEDTEKFLEKQLQKNRERSSAKGNKRLRKENESLKQENKELKLEKIKEKQTEQSVLALRPQAAVTVAESMDNRSFVATLDEQKTVASSAMEDDDQLLEEAKDLCEELKWARTYAYPQKFDGVTSEATIWRRGEADCPIQGRGEWRCAVILQFKNCDSEVVLNNMKNACGSPYPSPYMEGEFVVWAWESSNAESDSVVPQKKASPKRPDCMETFPPQFELHVEERFEGAQSVPPEKLNATYGCNEQEAKGYLKVFFPRSFCETFWIYNRIFSKCGDKVRGGKDTLTICDIGCGSGGATYGLIWALRKYLYGDPTFKKLCIYGYDTNRFSLNLLEGFKDVMKTSWKIEYEFILKECNFLENSFFKNETIDKPVDFVISSKALQEHRCSYRDYFEFANRNIAKNGLISMVLTYDSDNPKQLERLNNLRDAVRMEDEDARKVLLSNLEDEDRIFNTRCRTREMKESILFVVMGEKSVRGFFSNNA